MIELRSIHKSYPVQGTAVVALKDIDLTVASGEIFGIIGHSGAGKSTLLRMINFLERPTRGTVHVDGVDLQGLDDTALRRFRQGVGMIFQHFNLVGSKTVGDNVAFPLKIAGQADARRIDARVDELLDLVGLRRHKDKYPRQLSGGEKQRVGIARALANHPRVLLCDEATSALDPQTTRSILQLLRQINEKLGLTIVLITHEMDVIRTVCDRVAVIDSGTIVESGPVSTVFLHPQHETTRRFVQEAEHIQDEDVDAALVQSGARTLCRLTFMQDTVHQPILSQTARAFGIDFSILNGRIERIKSLTCGQMTVALEGPDEQVRNAMTRLAAKGVTVEELRA
ncbi:methionine ABC transporter ATP-binding protein [Bordetella genomosp. 11]|uniref:Cell division ATP-binding protein FtsE n=1 Tax=Bordetella genomosp. 11 TaxID=1416808 RepID=A0A261UQ88_9BORD|nr:methionine ABC transporter ATP-binding protein [Bordetella genomosp. 11]OZI63073.1 methionine ABC transporter ATP-binding protein [Bordetella genomosp. 11]